jgi:ABC-type antimicrobial peptide transport system permease subunit
VVVVDRAWADRFFPGETVIGRRLHEGGCTTCPWTTVVGVVGNVKFQGLDSTDQGTVYSPMDGLSSGYFVLRAAGDPAQLVAGLRRAVTELDPGLALTDIAAGDELLDSALTTPRYLSVLIGIFAVAALVMSVVGVYGVMAHFVQQHTRDIGIRLALGGEPGAMRRDVVLRGLRLVAAGVALGIGTAFYTAELIRSQLFGITPTDPLTLAAVPVALCAVAAIACLVPARRAARLDPATILRES